MSARLFPRGTYGRFPEEMPLAGMFQLGAAAERNGTALRTETGLKMPNPGAGKPVHQVSRAALTNQQCEGPTWDFYKTSVH